MPQNTCPLHGKEKGALLATGAPDTMTKSMETTKEGRDFDTSHPLDHMFFPRSIAVVGISADPAKSWIKAFYLDSLVRTGFPGHIYLINPRGGELQGLPIYRNLAEVPGPVDHVVISVPALHTREIMKDCIAKGVKVVHIFASGFAETGEPDRIALQDEIAQMARQAGIRVIGPNCIGIYYPAGGIGLAPDFYGEPGPIGYVCQSGGNVNFMLRHALTRGLRFSKVLSYGNACDIDECDMLDYFAADPETKVIAAYIEGTRDGRRLMDVLKKAAGAKPVVVFKGGYTAGGLRAAASHTGSLAGSDIVWDGAIKQAGAIRVYSVEEMVDILVALLMVRPPKGTNACVVGHGGGASVMATDELEREGLSLPPIPAEIRDKLKDFVDLANSMLRNPIDVSPMAAISGMENLMAMGNRQPHEFLTDMASAGLAGQWQRLNSILDSWREVDLIVYQHGFDVSPTAVDEIMGACIVGPMVLAAKSCKLPAVLVLHSFGNDNTWRSSASVRKLCEEVRVPLFLSMRGAAGAIAKLMEYNMREPERLAELQASIPGRQFPAA